MIWHDRIRLANGEVILPGQVLAIEMQYAIPRVLWTEDRLKWEASNYETGLEHLTALTGATFERGFQHGEERWYEGDEVKNRNISGFIKYYNDRFLIETSPLSFGSPSDWNDWHLVKEES